MITAQDVRDVVFSKSLGGYKTAEVDAFLDQCASTLETLAANEDENTRKMQVLAETVMDYRNQEDSIRTALVSAQRMAESITKEAQEKADAILAESTEKAEAVLAQARQDANNARDIANQAIAEEQAELARVRKEVSAFKAKLLAIYREHLTLIGVLEDEPSTAEEALSEEAAVSTGQEESTPAVKSEAPVAFDLSGLELKDEED